GVCHARRRRRWRSCVSLDLSPPCIWMINNRAKAILSTSLMLGSIGGLQAGSSAATSGVVTVDAKPEPIAINPKNTAVIVVDMENDFVSKGGMFDRAGVDISGAQKVRAPSARVRADGRAGGQEDS